jgi:hypothetical protein
MGGITARNSQPFFAPTVTAPIMHAATGGESPQ